jgi:hypothetical protein
MKSQILLLLVVATLFFSSCSSSRYGRLPKVKTGKQKTTVAVYKETNKQVTLTPAPAANTVYCTEQIAQHNLPPVNQYNPAKNTSKKERQAKRIVVDNKTLRKEIIYASHIKPEKSVDELIARKEERRNTFRKVLRGGLIILIIASVFLLAFSFVSQSSIFLAIITTLGIALAFIAALVFLFLILLLIFILSGAIHTDG